MTYFSNQSITTWENLQNSHLFPFSPWWVFINFYDNVIFFDVLLFLAPPCSWAQEWHNLNLKALPEVCLNFNLILSLSQRLKWFSGRSGGKVAFPVPRKWFGVIFWASASSPGCWTGLQLIIHPILDSFSELFFIQVCSWDGREQCSFHCLHHHLIHPTKMWCKWWVEDPFYASCIWPES